MKTAFAWVLFIPAALFVATGFVAGVVCDLLSNGWIHGQNFVYWMGDSDE